MARKLYISDLHLFHNNVIKFDNRPFASLEEMHNTIIEKWNAKVNDDDEVYILGDISMANVETTKEFFKKLKGKKFLIKGNHDRDGYGSFIHCEDYCVVKDGDSHVVLSHYPMVFYEGMHRGYIHLYGHVHNSKEEYYTRCIVDVVADEIGKKAVMMNVGCMVYYMDYEPKTLDELLAIYERGIDNGVFRQCVNDKT